MWTVHNLWGVRAAQAGLSLFCLDRKHMDTWFAGNKSPCSAKAGSMQGPPLGSRSLDLGSASASARNGLELSHKTTPSALGRPRPHTHMRARRTHRPGSVLSALTPALSMADTATASVDPSIAPRSAASITVQPDLARCRLGAYSITGMNPSVLSRTFTTANNKLCATSCSRTPAHHPSCQSALEADSVGWSWHMGWAVVTCAA